MTKDTAKIPVCMSVAGLDPSGGAGITADIKTFTAFGCFAAAAVTSVTFQNTQGVFGAIHQSADSVRRQVLPVIDDLGVDALKTGMLPTEEIIDTVASLIREKQLETVVVDPVVRSTTGFDLIDDAALRSLTTKLFPLSTVITPNLPEAERITGARISSESDIRRAGEKMIGMGARAVLIKGGHLYDGVAPAAKSARDFLFTSTGVQVFEAEWLETRATHGTGCTLAAAITANLAIGKDLVEAVRIAKDYVHQAIIRSPGLGHGASPIGFGFS